MFGNNASDTDIPADIFRFYLLYVRPESQVFDTLPMGRDNYNFFGIPDKMSGQINVSLTLSSHRNF